MTNSRQTTDFGFRTVDQSSKPALVQEVFESVAPKYDLMNDMMSLGIHRICKDALIDWLAPRSGQCLLDIAGGTGDVAERFVDRARGTNAIVLDMTENMLRNGKTRAENAGKDEHICWIAGDALALPFRNAQFDICTIAFGIRNVVSINDALDEAYRVLKRGGRLLVLEFSRVPVPVLAKFYDLYSFKVIPALGSLVAKDRDSYQYLVESIRRFPDQEQFSEILRSCRFEQVSYRNLTMGVAAIHSGWKL